MDYFLFDYLLLLIIIWIIIFVINTLTIFVFLEYNMLTITTSLHSRWLPWQRAQGHRRTDSIQSLGSEPPSPGPFSPGPASPGLPPLSPFSLPSGGAFPEAVDRVSVSGTPGSPGPPEPVPDRGPPAWGPRWLMVGVALRTAEIKVLDR